MAEVELDIFSGRPNPRWTLDKKQRDNLIDQLRGGNVTLLDPNDAEGVLGYRGFVITLDQSELALLGRSDQRAAQFRIRSGIAVDAETVAERWLLETTPAGVLVDAVSEEAESGIGREVNRMTLLGEGPQEVDILASCSIFSTSSTNFSFWNAVYNDRWNNNCYNYASNKKTWTMAQPGRGSGSMFTSLTLTNIANACRRDGWGDSCNANSLVFSLWIWPNTDFHFYRKTADVGGQSRWCHKPGRTNARNTDNSGNIITAPVNCNRGQYNTGAIVLWAPNGTVKAN